MLHAFPFFPFLKTLWWYSSAPLPGACSCSHSLGCVFLWDVLPWCSCSAVECTAWNKMPHHGLHHQLQGNLGPGDWVTYSFLSGLSVCRSASLTFCLALLCHTVFCPFLNKVSQRCHHLCWADSAISYSGLFGESLHQLCPFQHHVLLSKTCHINTISHLTTVRTYLTTGVKTYIHQTINYTNKSNNNKNSSYQNQSNIISILEKVDNSHTYCEGQPLLPSPLYNNKYSSTISLLFSNIHYKCCLLP